MEKIIIFDTNFLIANSDKNTANIEKLNENGYKTYITETIKDEYINSKLRERKNEYDKLNKMKIKLPEANINFKDQEKCLNIVKHSYNKTLNDIFKDGIIKYDKTTMLDRVLERNIYKLPPFIPETNQTTSDKGFKDTIIFLTMVDFLKNISEEAETYFVTKDNGFTKYKATIEDEVSSLCKPKFTIINENKYEGLFDYLNIYRPQENTKNIFEGNINEIDLDDIKAKLNDIILKIKYEENGGFDEFSGPYDVKRYTVYKKIDSRDAENFLDVIEQTIYENIFDKKIDFSKFFDSNIDIESYYPIDSHIMEELSNLYKKVRNTKYKKAFINFIVENINYNYTEKSNEDDLPF